MWTRSRTRWVFPRPPAPATRRWSADTPSRGTYRRPRSSDCSATSRASPGSRCPACRPGRRAWRCLDSAPRPTPWSRSAATARSGPGPATERMTRIQAWATPGRGAPLAPFEYERPPLGALDVEIEITHCGICRSDIHLIDDDWGSSQYPLVPGHEIAGLVRDCGGAVTALAPGERVGVGWQSGAGFECEWCLGAEEELCAHQRATCVGRPGGYGDR